MLGTNTRTLTCSQTRFGLHTLCGCCHKIYAEKRCDLACVWLLLQLCWVSCHLCSSDTCTGSHARAAAVAELQLLLCAAYLTFARMISSNVSCTPAAINTFFSIRLKSKTAVGWGTNWQAAGGPSFSDGAVTPTIES